MGAGGGGDSCQNLDRNAGPIFGLKFNKPISGVVRFLCHFLGSRTSSTIFGRLTKSRLFSWVIYLINQQGNEDSKATFMDIC